MRGRLAALFTLFALVLSVAETGQASVCAHGQVAVTLETSHAGHGGADHSPEPSHEGTSCPLGLTAGCAVSTSILSTFDFVVVNAEGNPIVIPAASDGLDRIFSSSAFHPPRA